MPVERIARFIGGTTGEGFEALALDAFAHQYERQEAYRAVCERGGATPDTVRRWEDVPLVPTLAYKRLRLASEAPREIFRSSGTSAPERSVHHHPYPELYRRTIEASFPTFALPTTGTAETPILSLIPSRDQLPDSSLSFMVDHVLATWGDATSGYALGRVGVDARKLRAWLAGRQRGGTPGLILTTSLALLEALDRLERLGLRFRMPPGSVLFETGGYKGRNREATPDELLERTQRILGIAPDRVVREYGMTELTSQLYTASLSGGPADVYVAPDWVRIRVLDAETLAPAPAGEPGLVAIFDLANLGSATHVLTEDVGSLSAAGLRLVGRAAGAELRGCSLAAEELTGVGAG